MNVYSLRRLALWHKQEELQQPVMTATRSATDFEIMQQEHIEQLKTELAEARAEIERLKKNRQLASAINIAMQEASINPDDYTGHECLAKHKLLSLYDLWRKRVKPRLPGFIDDEISRRDAPIEQMREALEEAIAIHENAAGGGHAAWYAKAKAALDAAKGE